MRLDKLLAQRLGVSRSQVTQLIKKGLVKVDGVVVKKGGVEVTGEEEIEVGQLERETTPVETPDWEVPILYQDSNLLILNKPPGVVVHPAPSYRGPTLVEWLKGRGFSLSTLAGEERVGILHRLDKETTGALMVAKNNWAHAQLAEQLKSREMGRYYLMVLNQPLKRPVIVEKPIGRNPKDRKKMGVVAGGRPAKTLFIPVAGNLVLAKLYTGRTHQIRVHLKELGRWILGDSVYGKGEGADRVMLHGYQLYYRDPESGERRVVTAPLWEDFRQLIGDEGERRVAELPELERWTREVELELKFPKLE